MSRASRSSSAFGLGAASAPRRACLDAVISLHAPRDCLRGQQRNPDPSCGLPAASSVLCASAQRRLGLARSRPARRSGTGGAGMSSGARRPGEGAAPAWPRAASAATPGVSALHGVADPRALADLRAQAAGLQQRVGVRTSPSSGSCGRARRRRSAPPVTMPSAMLASIRRYSASSTCAVVWYSVTTVL